MSNKRILVSVYCILIQHGYHVFCRLIPKGAVATQEYSHIFHQLIESFTYWFIHLLFNLFAVYFLLFSWTHSLINFESLTDLLNHSYWLTDWLTHSLTDSLTHSLTYWLTDWLTHSLTHTLTHSHTHSIIYSLTHSLTKYCVGYLIESICHPLDQ